jgi:hypothetical protein
MAGKTIVSTPLSQETFQALEAFRKKVHRTRAEVIRGLLYALLDGKEEIYREWLEALRK